MDYNHISSFLNKVKLVLFKNEEHYDVVAQIIKKHISYPIETKSIKIKGTTIYIQGSPLLKNEILIHKVGILNDLSDLIIDRKFTNIN